MTLLRALSTAAAALLLSADGAAQSAEVTGGSHRSVRDFQRDVVEGKKPRVAVEPLENRSGVRRFRGGKHVGEGMKEMLESALMETGRFLVFEREALDAVIGEQDLGQSDRFRKAGGSRLGELETVDFLVKGAVTEMMQDQAGGGGRLEFGKGRRKKKGLDLFGLGGAVSQDHVAIDLKLIDVRTGQLVATATVEGKATDFSIDGLLGAGLGDVGKLLLSGGGEAKTPLQKALRVCIVKAVDWVAERIVDEGFYRADQSPWEEAEPSSPPQPPPAAPREPEREPAPEPALAVASPIATVRSAPRDDARVLALVGFGDELAPDAAQPRMGEWVPIVLADGRTGWIGRGMLRH